MIMSPSDEGQRAMPAKRNPRFLIAAGLAVPLFAQMGYHMTNSAQAAPRVNCTIKAAHQNGTGKLDAVIMASGPIEGTFIFTVRKSSGGEPVTQSGDFKVDDEKPVEIKKASIDLEPGQAYDASLKVQWPNGSSSCSSSVR
jgi:CsgH protein